MLSEISKISKVRLFTLILQHYGKLLILLSNIYFYFHMRNRFRICLTYFHSGMKFFGRLKFMYLMEKTRKKFSMYIKFKTWQCGMIWTSSYIIPNKLTFFGIRHIYSWFWYLHFYLTSFIDYFYLMIWIFYTSRRMNIVYQKKI